MKRPALLQKVFAVLWQIVTTYPRRIIVIGTILAVISAGYSFFFLKLNSDQDDLVSSDVPFHKRYLEHLENFGDQEYIYIVIRTDGSDEIQLKAKELADYLAGRLKTFPSLIRSIYYRITPEDLGDATLFMASLEDAKSLSETVIDLSPATNLWLDDLSLSGLFDAIGTLLSSEHQAQTATQTDYLLQGMESLQTLLKRINTTLSTQSYIPQQDPIFNFTGAAENYFFTEDGRLLIMQVLPEKDYSTMDVIQKPLTVVREVLGEAHVKFPDMEVGLTGRPVLQADEMQTTDRDMSRAAVIAFILVGLLFTLVLHGWLRPLMVMLSLIMAMSWTFGFATLAVGELNLLSIVFALILVGIGVDFGLHIVMRYIEAEKAGATVEEAVRTALFRTGPGVVLAAITSVCAFFVVLGSDFRGIAELGLIGGVGILLCLVAMLTILPAMLSIAGEKNLFPSSTPRLVNMPLLERLTSYPGRLLLVVIFISVILSPGLLRVQFNYNILDLQATGLESVKYEKMLIEASGESTWYAISVVDSIDEVKERSLAMEKLSSVAKVESILDYIPAEQVQKSSLYSQAAQSVNDIPMVGDGNAAIDEAALISSLEQLLSKLEDIAERLMVAGAGNELAAVDQSIDQLDSALQLLAENKSKVSSLQPLEFDIRKEILGYLHQIKRWLTAGFVTPETLPVVLRDIYIGADGSFQLKVTPHGNVWDFDTLEIFVTELREIDAQVSGVPVGVLESARLMHRTFLMAAGFTILVVSIILWLSSRSLILVFLTLLPLAVGMLWLLSIMGLFGVHFNLANFFAIPILIAIGVDGGVHLLARWQELDRRKQLFFTSTPTAVTLSFSTTMIGFGGLLLAHHRGLASLGVVMVLGSFTCMMACLVVLPTVLKISGKNLISGNE